MVRLIILGCPWLASHRAKDLYGRGYSDAPQTTYHPGLFTTQLALLMQHLKWDKATIVGVSMVRTGFLNISDLRLTRGMRVACICAVSFNRVEA